MTDRVRVVCVPGTHGKATDGEWADPAGGFAGFLAARGLDYAQRRDPYTGRYEPFRWSGDLSGWWWTGSGKHSAWEAAGDALRWWVCDQAAIPPAETRVLTHSHGLQVALKAAAKGMKIAVLFDVCGPVRDDMGADVAKALPNIGYWFHLRAQEGDGWQLLGSLDLTWPWFHTHLDALWHHPTTGRLYGAHQNASVPGVGHTKLLDDPRSWHLWDSQGYLDVLQMPVGPQSCIQADQ